MGSTFADSDYGDTVESQLTLGTASLLGIFFGLVMVCGIFFGFGYSIGRRNASALAASTPPAHVAPAPAPVMAQPAPNLVASLSPEVSTTAANANVQTVSPAAPINLPATTLAATPRVAPVPHVAATSPANRLPFLVGSNRTASMQSASLPVASAEHAYVEPKARIAKPSAIQPSMEQSTAKIPLERVVAGPQFTAPNLPSTYLVWTPPFDVHYKKGFKHGLTQAASHGPLTGVSHPAGAYATARTTMPHLSTASPAMTVQVAALSRQDDAEVLVSSLKQHGFAPSIQSGNEDALYHVQVGPFSRDVAFATRQRLIARGYNATLK